MWSRVLKEARPGRGERVIPLRPLQLVLPPDRTRAAAGGDAASQGGGGEAPGGENRDTLAVARAEAAAILDQARQEAAAIKDAARAEGEQVLAEARVAGEARGYQEGLERAREEAGRIRQEAEGIRQQARQVLVEARQAYQDTIAAAEGEIIDLALAIAARIIGREVELRPDLVLEIARPAVRQVAEGQHYIIYAAPEAAEVIRQRRAELLAEAAPGARLQVLADPAFKAGGCRVETENGFVDASIDTQLAAVKKILRADNRAPRVLPSVEERGSTSAALAGHGADPAAGEEGGGGRP
ncbi:MAG: flagellar assembly protein FliH [Clostridia bacterium]|nr:flagellar assembly protein FliH [Clostridia bacterium]